MFCEPLMERENFQRKLVFLLENLKNEVNLHPLKKLSVIWSPTYLMVGRQA